MPLRDIQPYHGYQQAKRLLWDPQEIDLAQDKVDWEQLGERERDLLSRAVALFYSGEEAVTHDLTPLLLAIKNDKLYIEEEMFLTTQLFEEAKHFEFFDRWITEVIGGLDVAAYSTPSYETVFYQSLPQALDRLLTDQSALAQAMAAVNYHMIVEGTLAETGYHAYGRALKDNHLMPGLVQAIQNVQRDEARHIAYGIYLLQRLIQQNPELWQAVDQRLGELLMPALGVVTEALTSYGDDIPFGLNLGEFLMYAQGQYSSRYEAIKRVVISATS